MDVLKVREELRRLTRCEGPQRRGGRAVRTDARWTAGSVWDAKDWRAYELPGVETAFRRGR
ncbi:hypothetical protein SNL152K_6171 [Streptomyces sp. NL15-2K]|nr:hypothetical protein SNL152K_6171 [Streptomyces sp. NL15-2K]